MWIFIQFVLYCFLVLLAVVSPLNAVQVRSAVVSGQSITGMIAAAVLAKAGYRVDTYEMRDRYTRNIQWAARQFLVNELASIDVELGRLFLQEVAGSLDRGSIHIHPSGFRREKKHDGLSLGDPLNIPNCGRELMADPSVMNIEAKIFEGFLEKYLSSMPNVTRHVGCINLIEGEEGYAVEGVGIPDLIVIAEGANSENRKTLGIGWIPMTEKKLEISGAIGIDSGGVMIKHWRREEGKLMLTGAIGRKGSHKTWIVADVDPSIVENQEKIDREFRRLAGACLGLSLEEVLSAEIFGVADGVPITPFALQQEVAATATIGNNIILIGDSVGTGHWSVGGGMQIGAVCHVEKLKELLSDLSNGCSKVKALKKYSDGVLNDTFVWGEVGLKDFYPSEQNFEFVPSVSDSR